MAANPNDFDYTRAGEPFPALAPKSTPTGDFDFIRAGEPIPVLVMPPAAGGPSTKTTTHFIDSTLLKTQSASYIIDADLAAGVTTRTATHVIDGTLLQTKTPPHVLDSTLLATKTATIIYDGGSLHRTQTATYSLDAILTTLPSPASISSMVGGCLKHKR